jgi:hypothetical protein
MISNMPYRPKQPFWVLEAKSDGPDGTEDSRCILEEPPLGSQWLDKLLGNKPLQPGEFEFTAEANWPDRFEHFPFSISGLFIVSGYFRELLCNCNPPGFCHFYPLTVTYQGAVISRDYHVAHLVLELDCIDRELSGPPDPNPVGSIEYIRAVIDPRLVPDDVSLFKVKGHLSRWVVRDSLRKKIKKAGITGCLFYQP